ncbi:MAG: glyoxalase family protein [Gaiellaceae bacterium]|nr:glyoxalase family protein [Gaiellaceae bacterium]
MKLEGVHHVTCITGDAQRNVDFYTGLMGLRLVKKSINQDDPSVYHLFYADEHGDPGSDLTFFEYRGARPGRAGAGMVHRICWRVGSDEALDFWAQRLGAAGIEIERSDAWLRFRDEEGLEHELAVSTVSDPPLRAEHPEIPAALALQGFDGVRAYAHHPEASRELFDGALAFEPRGEATWEARGEQRGGTYALDPPPEERGVPGAGTVHHVAWASLPEEEEAWRERLVAAGAGPTPVIDRFYFRSIYFREPSGVLFEIATMGPGFAVDEPAESLGEALSLPPNYVHLREQVEAQLTPLTNPRSRG